MGLERKLSAMEMINTMNDMSARPEYYSGRGAIAADLDSRRLENIYQLVKRERGEDAAQNFALMVADIPVLSATDFLITLYKLDSNDWKWDKSLLGNEKGIDLGPDNGNGGREAVAMATIGNVLGGMSERDETPYIRGEFLKKHNLEEPRTRQKDSYYYNFR
ncbi:MAG: hypothetical protein Q7S27_07445 [Nanoarchaeota archaeon]|nr:hypothetical protein [Nanoarchaeota archaeon]